MSKCKEQGFVLFKVKRFGAGHIDWASPTHSVSLHVIVSGLNHLTWNTRSCFVTLSRKMREQSLLINLASVVQS